MLRCRADNTYDLAQEGDGPREYHVRGSLMRFAPDGDAEENEMLSSLQVIDRAVSVVVGWYGWREWLGLFEVGWGV